MARAPLALRVAALAIAALGWLDPSFAAPGPTRVAVVDHGSTRTLATLVHDALAPGFEVVSWRDPSADAWIVVAEDEEAEVPLLPPGVALSLVVPASSARAVRLERLDAPARVAPHTRARLSVTLAARGLEGMTARVAARVGTLEMGHIDHRVTRPDERFTARFDLLLPHAGVNHVTVEARGGGAAGPDDRLSRAGVAIVVDAHPVPVLVFEARPSWTTTFARRGLEQDARFAIVAMSRVSRRIDVTSIEGARAEDPAPSGFATLSARALERFAVVIVGAPEALSAREVDALEAFATERGGAVVLAPDRRLSGPVLELLDSPRLREHLLDQPARIELIAAPGLPLFASELLSLDAVTGATGIESLAAVDPSAARPGAAAAPGAASVLVRPKGRGQILFVGALDAWRFRDRADRAFDRWWAQIVEGLARTAPDPLSVTLDRAVVAPGTRIEIAGRLRDAGDGPLAVDAHLTPADDPGRSTPVRVWPDSAAGSFAGALNAPETPGVYAVSVRDASGTSRTRAEAVLVVEPNGRTARGADERWRAVTRARRGIVATPATIEALRTSILALESKRPPGRWFPFRSAWWLLPLTACLGGEWWLRRRAGLR